MKLEKGLTLAATPSLHLGATGSCCFKNGAMVLLVTAVGVMVAEGAAASSAAGQQD